MTTRSIRLFLFFHILRQHKEDLNVFRVWFGAKYLLDQEGSGMVNFNELCKLTKLSPRYLKDICRNTMYFRPIKNNKVFYSSEFKIIKELELNTEKFLVRGENITKKLRKIVSKNTRFMGYILRCYVELDRDYRKAIKGRITRGRIGHERLAEIFGLSRPTVLKAINSYEALSWRNIISHKTIRFANRSKIGSWLLDNMESVIDNSKVIKNPKSFFTAYDKRGGYHLLHETPKIYKFTGAYLSRVRGLPGNASQPEL